MTLQQSLTFAVLGGTMVLFIWGKLRYDLVALLALLTAVLVGIVPYDEAFTGFSDDIVIIVASALLVSAAVERSDIVETALRPDRALSDDDDRAGHCAGRHRPAAVRLRQEYRCARHADAGRIPARAQAGDLARLSATGSAIIGSSACRRR
jgi:Citrate transporter